MQHLYEGYKNLIERILENKAVTIQGSATPRSFSGLTTGQRGVHLAKSASQRFERLRDRIQLLILSETEEFLAEKEALISTVLLPMVPSSKRYANIVQSTSTSTHKKTPKPQPA